MGKEISTFGDIEIEKNKFCHHKPSIFSKDIDIEEVLVSKRFLLVKKAISTLLVTFTMIKKLSHYI